MGFFTLETAQAQLSPGGDFGPWIWDLKLLAEHAGEPVTREQFLESVWGYHAYPTTRTVDNQILSLRTKLEPDPAEPRHLLTVHGVGYRLEMTKP